MFRVMIAGTRSFNDYDLLRNKMNNLLKNVTDEVIIVSGTANGADKLGERYAIEKDYKVDRYPADWENVNVESCSIGKDKNGRIYNKLAGHNRNLEMIKNSDAAVYFWDGISTGTKHCIENAKISGLKVRIIKY